MAGHLRSSGVEESDRERVHEDHAPALGQHPLIGVDDADLDNVEISSQVNYPPGGGRREREREREINTVMSLKVNYRSYEEFFFLKNYPPGGGEGGEGGE
jgi:hypothetical protein